MGRSLRNGSARQATPPSDAAFERGDDFITSLEMSERIIYLSGEVNETSIAHAISGMIVLSNQNKKAPITLIVSTYGGSVDEMFSLYDVMKYVPAPVHTVGLGKVMSAGVLLLASGRKGYRMIGESARLMIHPISGGMEGNVFQAHNELVEFDRQQKLMEELYLRETKLTKQQLTTLMSKGHDNYITAKDAIKFGIVDAIINPREK